jgi:hypothetical protein
MFEIMRSRNFKHYKSTMGMPYLKTDFVIVPHLKLCRFFIYILMFVPGAHGGAVG